MSLLGSFVKNVFCDVVKPRIGSILKVDLAGGLLDHTGVYIGDDEIVEVTQVDGRAKVQIVSAEEFLEGDGCARTGAFIYVACKQDRNGKCIAMGSKDIAERARNMVGREDSYNLIYNNCHMFVEYCITGKQDGLSGLLKGVEIALDNKFIVYGYERLLDIWRSTGESRGSNPSFQEDSDELEFEENLENAQLGDMEAAFKVAESYYYGNGVDEDDAMAAKWYEKAARMGNVEAMMRIAQCYYIGEGVKEDDAKAKLWYELAAAEGNEEAKNKLKSCF